MKRYVLLVGGTGARLADALLAAVSAGVFPAEKLEVLLADTDRRGVRSAGLVAAKMADYARIHQAMQGKDGPFRTEVAFSSWPQELPEETSSLNRFASGSETDRLLSQALFDEAALKLDLHEGFHGRRMLGAVTYEALLQEAEQDYDDVLACMVADMNTAIAEGEEVRVVLAGSICGGTGAAGIAALTRYIRSRTQDAVNVAGILLAACDDEQDAAHANETLAEYAREELLDTVCVLGLPQASRSAAPAEFAHLTDWLAIYCMDVLLHRPQWVEGVFTVKAPAGPLSWEIFGKAAERYRLCYGGLIKFASAWVGGLSAKVEKRLRKPSFIRDELFGWYAHFFRRLENAREEQLELLEPLSRLMKVCMIWLGGICKSLPVDLRHASVLAASREEAENHYRELLDIISRLAGMDDEAQRTELYEDNLVYRSKNSAEASEAEMTIRRIEAARKEVARRAGEQELLNRRMGGTAAMDMLYDALEAAQQEAETLQARYDEAVRRIDHAEKIAAPEDQYRITDARTKLHRMERHQLMQANKLQQIIQDVERAGAEGIRFEKPALVSAEVENGMFLQEMMDALLRRDDLSMKTIEALWPRMVCPGNTLTIRQTMKVIRRAPVDKQAPLMSLVYAMLEAAMKEV